MAGLQTIVGRMLGRVWAHVDRGYECKGVVRKGVRWEGVGCAEEISKPAASQGALVEALASQECHAAELAS